MVRVAVFGKQGCARCESTRKKLDFFISRWDLLKKVSLVFHDMDTFEGRAEGAFYDVEDVPATIVMNDDRKVARWDGEIPDSKQIRVCLEDATSAPEH